MHVGNSFLLGQLGGEENHTLIMGEMSAHSHFVQASSNAPNSATPLNNFFASSTGFSPYGGVANEQMASTAMSNTGGSLPHNNMSPFSVLSVCIALQGIFPSRN